MRLTDRNRPGKAAHIRLGCGIATAVKERQPIQQNAGGTRRVGQLEHRGRGGGVILVNRGGADRLNSGLHSVSGTHHKIPVNRLAAAGNVDAVPVKLSQRPDSLYPAIGVRIVKGGVGALFQQAARE